jgi:beta-carotene 3-hydroxylase
MNTLIVLITFTLMEGATWIIHKYVMHGFLWVLHRDHHDHSTEGPFEKNDWFFFIFALPAILLMYLGADQRIQSSIFHRIGYNVLWHGLFFCA